jgi:hypothetical protein
VTSATCSWPNIPDAPLISPHRQIVTPLHAILGHNTLTCWFRHFPSIFIEERIQRLRCHPGTLVWIQTISLFIKLATPSYSRVSSLIKSLKIVLLLSSWSRLLLVRIVSTCTMSESDGRVLSSDTTLSMPVLAQARDCLEQYVLCNNLRLRLYYRK